MSKPGSETWNPFEARRFSEDYRRIGAAIRRELVYPWRCPRCGGPKAEHRTICLACSEVAQDEREREEAGR